MESLQQGAEAGNAQAQYQLGARLLVGRGAPFAPPQGLKWVQAAASQRHPQALALLAVLTSLSGDWPEAFKLLRRAADAGEPLARVQAGILANPAQFDREQWNLPLAPRWQSESPRIGIIERCIPRAFCDWIIGRARWKLDAARVQDPATGEVRQMDVRTNSGTGFSLVESDLLLQMVNARVGAAIGVPLSHQEPTNVLHYAPGEEYRAHYDYFTQAEPHVGDLQVAGQRTVTVLIYLNDDYEGGETDFPELGWRYKGSTGDALMFWNTTPEGEPDPRTLHAGLPPTRGEKWLYSKWVRAKPYPLL